LVLVGDGPERPKIEQEIAARRLEGIVRLMGQRRDVPQLLPGADLFLLTSISEGIPVTFIEAMAARLPIVSTDVGGVTEVVEDGQTGLLASAGDDAALAQAMLRLVEDPTLRDRLGATGRVRAERLFSQRQMHASYAKVYDEMLRGSRARRMRILFITEQFPYPLHDGGSLRTYHVLRGLAEQHDMHLLAHGPKGDGAARDAVSKMCMVHTVDEPTTVQRVTYNVMRLGLHKYPLFLLKNWSFRLLTAADELLRRHDFDAMHFNHLDTACFALARSWPQFKVFDTHNCLTALASQVSTTSTNRLRQELYRQEADRLRQIEYEVCKRMDACLVCSQEDARAFREIHDGGQYVIAPNGVETSYFQPSEQVSPEPGALVFTGAMSYYPNEQAAIYFCREILPHLREGAPSARIYLVGKDPSPQVQSLHDGDSVIVTGRVEDVRPYIDRAQVFVVPLRHGSGTRLKILEAFAMGKAVVSTPQGAAGIPAVHEKHILLADDSRSFANQIRRLVASDELRIGLGDAARKFVEQQFDWRQIQQTVLAAYRNAQCHSVL
jgi:polysaccharide biosynthesis protein PslH